MSARIKPPRILVRFDSQIASAPDPVQADCKRAERAAYLARLGRGAEAQTDIDAIRVRQAVGPPTAVIAWLNLAEGLLGQFRFNHSGQAGPGARDKLLRAHALGTAIGLTPLQALAAGWLAHIAFLRADFEAMVRHATEALRIAAADHHAVHSGVCLVLAKAHHLSGRLALALPWYERCRQHAVDDGDDAILSAQMHDMAWLRAQDIRAADCGLTGVPAGDPAHAVLGAESTVNFDRLIGSVNLHSTARIQRAQIMTVQRRFVEAVGLFEAEVADAAGADPSRLAADLLADRAWCRAHLQLPEAALADARRVQSIADPGMPPGNRAMVQARLAQTFDALDRPDEANAHRGLASAAWEAHRAVQADLVGRLAGLSAPVPARAFSG